MATPAIPLPTRPDDAAQLPAPPPADPLPSEPLGILGLRIRPLDPATDGPRLRAMCPRVSLQSRYQRFFSGIGYLSDPLLALLLDVDHRRREALVVLQGEAIVAVGRYATSTADAAEADVSLLVVDDLHRHGIARELLHRLEDLAGERGFVRLAATVLGENRQVRGLLLATHPEARGRFAGGVYTYRLPLMASATGAPVLV